MGQTAENAPLLHRCNLPYECGAGNQCFQRPLVRRAEAVHFMMAPQ